MNSVEMFFSSDEEENVNLEAIRKVNFTRRFIRTKSNPLDLPNRKFIKDFRLSKEAFAYLLKELIDKMKLTMRSTSVPPILKLAATLRFFAEGGYEEGTGSDFVLGLAQPTLSKILKEMINLLETIICPHWIKLEMTETTKDEAKLWFFEKTGFPGVIGCVDGTHIKIFAPNKEQQHLYYNRKGFYSLNAMIVCDHKMKIRYLDAIHPGSCHDSFIWNSSDLRNFLNSKFENGDKNSWMLGDAGYPLEPFLMTPFRAVAEGSRECSFNSKHSQTRNIIERTIGVLKNRFRCLLGARMLHYTPEKAAQITNVCSALHNICITYKVELIEPRYVIDEIETHEIDEHLPINTTAVDIRNNLVNSMC